jgi:ABC-2 type transport system ATP-binding protein
MTSTRVTSTETAPAPVAGTRDDDAVRVRGLLKRYGDRTVVDGIDLDVRRGEVFACSAPTGGQDDHRGDPGGRAPA